MKKYILGFVASIILAFSPQAQAANFATNITAGTFTNLALLINGSAKVTQFIITSTGTNYGTLSIYDSPTNSVLYTNAAYTNILTYVTNYVSVWTNYYGRTNTVTNSASLVDVTNSVAGTTNTYPLRVVESVGTNVSATVNGSFLFQNGISVSNGSGSTLTISATYQQ